MSLFIASLNSGSNGNCYYIGNQHEAVLIDAGISCRETETRMNRLNLSMQKVKAIFVSHEHSDHISGIPVLAKKYKLPVYITTGTYNNCCLGLHDDLIIKLESYKTVKIGELQITAFPKFHDAAEPHSFMIICNDVKVGVFTDIGSPCAHLIKHFVQCNAAFLEANYDNDMLRNGRYPYHLKRRITSEYGHLSNAQALELFTRHKPVFMSHLLLAHLSKDNNSPELVYDLFNRHANGTHITVASRYRESPVFAVRSQMNAGFAIADKQYSLF